MSPILAAISKTATACTELLAFYTWPRYRLVVPRHMCVVRRVNLHARDDIAEWCDVMMPDRWRVVFTSNRRAGEFHFRHQGDLMLFKLMWSDDIADKRLRLPEDIWPVIERR